MAPSKCSASTTCRRASSPATRQYNGKPTVFYSVSFSRSYKDPRGERKFTKSFDTDDLGKIVELSQRASETIRDLQDPAALPNL